jgi:hypothetical protein
MGFVNLEARLKRQAILVRFCTTIQYMTSLTVDAPVKATVERDFRRISSSWYQVIQNQHLCAGN